MDTQKLVIIGGAEDKKGSCLILKKFLHLAGGNEAKIVVITSASSSPEETGSEYKEVFKKLGSKMVKILNISDRSLANDEELVNKVLSASGIFITGGDQLRFTSILGGTRLLEAIEEKHKQGIVIAGTSAGASVMSSTMIVEGADDESPSLSMVKMSPGIGLFSGAVIDQHFAQRGRIGRLLMALGQNPSLLGLGIDEDTAIIIEGEEMQVWGTQTVTVLDGWGVIHSNASLLSPSQNLAICNVIVHILPHGYIFNLASRKPGMKNMENQD